MRASVRTLDVASVRDNCLGSQPTQSRLLESLLIRVDLGNSMGEEPGRTMSQLQTSWTPRNPYQSGGHDPETNEHSSKLMGDRLVSPSCCTDNSFSLVLLVNLTELGVDKLCNIPDERKYLPDSIIYQRESSKEVHDSSRN